MSEGPQPLGADVGARDRAERRRDAARLLPVFGALLFTPIVLGFFDGEGKIAGLPLVVAFIFAVWAGLILAARALAYRLDADEKG